MTTEQIIVAGWAVTTAAGTVLYWYPTWKKRRVIKQTAKLLAETHAKNFDDLHFGRERRPNGEWVAVPKPCPVCDHDLKNPTRRIFT